MDAQRFDQMAKAVAREATRRAALRRSGVAMAGALLAAAGPGRRAGAQDTDPCDDLLARCAAAAQEACGHLRPTSLENYTCLADQGGTCTAYFKKCAHFCGAFGTSGRACAGGCPAHEHCVVAITPSFSQLVCLCVNAD